MKIDYYIYILEVRNRAFLTFLTWLFTIVVSYFYKETLFFYTINSADGYKENLLYNYFIFTDVTEIFQVNIKLIFFISNQVLLLHFLYNLLIFISPGLYFFEYKKIYFFIKIVYISFIVSVLLLNIYIIPFSWDFFLRFQKFTVQSVSLFFEAKISEYLVFYINLYYFCFVTCSLCLFFLLFSIIFSNSVMQIKNLRKIFYFVFFVISTLITPPDVFSQLFFSFFLICLYELMIFLTILKKLIRKPVETNQHSHGKH